MKTSLISARLAATLLAAVVTSSAALAQTAATVPVGFMTYSFPATGTSGITTSNIAVPLLNPADFSGPVQSLTSTSITFANSSFTSGSLAQAGGPYFARIASGAQSGRVMLITANTANSITVDVTDNSVQTTELTAPGFALAAGDRVEVIPGDTLASFFGDNSGGNPLVLVGAASVLSADTINLYNKSTAKQDTYYFSTSLGYWRASNSTVNVNSKVLYFGDGISINRRAGRSAMQFTVLGQVSDYPRKIKTSGNNSGIFTSTGFPVPMTLAQLNIANWTKSNSALSADTIAIFNVQTAKNDVYFQRTDNSWRKVGNSVTDQSGLSIPPDTAFSIFKRAAVSGSVSYFAFQMPYTL